VAAGADGRRAAGGEVTMDTRAQLTRRRRGGRLAALAGLAAVLGSGGVADAQTWVGTNIEGGLYWHVSTRQGASWKLVCRYPPVTYYRNAYDRKAWINRFERSGQGADAGRLPLNSGHCHLWKTGGQGAVGLGLARPGEAVGDATADPSEPAAVGFM